MSGFEPFDTALAVLQLRVQVPELHDVGGAADYAAVKELRHFRAPSAFVIFGAETNTGSVPASPGVCVQESRVEIGVVLALRHYSEIRGEQMQQEARVLIGAVRRALIGWRAPVRGARALAWSGGKVLDYDAGVLLFADMYELQYLLHKEE